MILAVDGFATGVFSTASSGTVTLTTSLTNDIVVVAIGFESTIGQGAQTVSSVAASGLTFHQRGAQAYLSPASPNANVQLEIWWASAASALTSEIITVTLSGTIDNESMVAFGVNGVLNLAAPWDTNASLPAFTTGSPATAPTFSTTQRNDFLLAAGTTPNIFQPGQSPPYTAIATANNTGGVNFSHTTVAYDVVSTPQSGATGGVTAPLSPGILYSDALTAGGNQAQPLVATI